MRSLHRPPGPGSALALAVLLLLAPRAALAHDGAPPEPHDLWTAWSAEPLVLAGLLFGFALYSAGVSRVWKRAGAGHGVTTRQIAAFGAGWLTLWIALVSPLDALSSALFSAHMAQHLLLILVAAPLFVLARPLAAFSWGLPAGPRLGIARSPWAHRAARRLRWLALPAIAWTLHALTLWAWHLPALYDWALESAAAHALEHAAFFGTALLFWAAILRPSRHGMGYAAAILYVFTMGLQSALLGALITFASTPWYATYATTTSAWGLSPLEDQQLAGAIMWAPAGLAYVIVVVAHTAAALRDIEERLDGQPASGDGWLPPDGSSRRAESVNKGKAVP
jgi:putative membrane protein